MAVACVLACVLACVRLRVRACLLLFLMWWDCRGMLYRAHVSSWYALRIRILDS